MKQFVKLSKLSPGDQVAVISPSAGLPGLFPWVQDLGLTRLKEEFGLNPAEYPTTRQMGSCLEDRARDVMAAFTDPANKAVFSSIGGSDQIRLIKHLNPQVFVDNPKPFFGFSDNTHLHNFLWNLGVPSYYGGGVMNQLGMNVVMHDITRQSIQRALFEVGEFELPVATEYNDIGLNWAEASNLDKPRQMEKNDGWFWDGQQDTEGILWGGCVESLIAQVSANKYLPADEDMEGVILILETSEGIPEHWLIKKLLTGFGERSWLDKFAAVLVGRPKAWDFDKPNDSATKDKYRQDQREAVLSTVRAYNHNMPIIQNLDFGHTDPQISMPLGQKARIDTAQQKVFLCY